MSNLSAEQGYRDNIHMHKSRFADAKPGRTLDPLTTQLRSRCALIGQNRVKAEVQRAGDSPREVPNSTGLCKTHTYTTIFSPVFGISVSQDWTALVSKTQIGIFTVTRMKVRRQSLSGSEGNLRTASLLVATDWMSSASPVVKFREYGTVGNGFRSSL